MDDNTATGSSTMMASTAATSLRFRRLRLRNWKNFLEVDVPIHDRMFLLGANGSGKSNLLDAFRFLRDLASPGGFRAAIAHRRGVDAIRCLAAPPDAEVGIEVDVENENDGSRWCYRLSFGQDAERRPGVRAEHVSCNGRVILDRPKWHDRRDPARAQQTHLEQVSRNDSFRHLGVLFRSISDVVLVPQAVRNPGGTVGRFRDVYGGRFVEEIAQTPEDQREFALGRIEKALRIAVPRFDSLDLVKDRNGMHRLAARNDHWPNAASVQMEDEFSDGTLRLIGLFWTVMTSTGPLLVDGPELILHPDVVRMLPQALQSAQRGVRRQLFVSTHSPNLMWDEGIGLDETLMLLTDHDATTAVPAESVEQVNLLVEGGSSVVEAAVPQTQPNRTWRLALFADDG